MAHITDGLRCCGIYLRISRCYSTKTILTSTMFAEMRIFAKNIFNERELYLGNDLMCFTLVNNLIKCRNIFNNLTYSHFNLGLRFRFYDKTLFDSNEKLRFSI